MSSPPYNAQDTLIKNVYDSANYGQTIMIPLVTDSSLTLQTITPSASTFNQLVPFTGIFTIDDINQIVSNIDEISIAHEGDDAIFNRIYQWQPESYGVVYKANIIAGFGLNVSAFTSGTADLDSVQVILTQHLADGTIVKEIFNKTVTATFTALTATGTLIFLVDIEHSIPFDIDAEKPLRLQIIVNHTQTLTNTLQVGILPLFCYNSEATNKVFTTSVLKLHIHSSLKNAFPVLRGTSETDRLDFSGIDKQGHPRT